MIATIAAFFSNIWGKVTMYVTIALGIIVVVWQIIHSLKAAGKREAEAEANKRTLSNVETANAARREIEFGDPNEIPEHVRKFYLKD